MPRRCFLFPLAAAAVLSLLLAGASVGAAAADGERESAAGSRSSGASRWGAGWGKAQAAGAAAAATDAARLPTTTTTATATQENTRGAVILPASADPSARPDQAAPQARRGAGVVLSPYTIFYLLNCFCFCCCFLCHHGRRLRYVEQRLQMCSSLSY
jgi:hypothetical protein